MKKNNFEITVVVTRFGETDDVVKQCLHSLSLQKDCSVSVLFLDQKRSGEIKNYCLGLESENIEFQYIEIPAKSLSYARNYGVEHAVTPKVAFCDSDCILPLNWASEILNTFKVTHATVVGTKILPRWQAKTSWYHNSKIIREFYSLLDLSSERIPVKKVVGASFAFDKDKVTEEIFFDEELGRQKGILLGGEETDLCKRILNKGGKIIYTPITFAYHTVERERINIWWIWKRSFYGGLSRAMRSGKIEPFNSKKDLIDYLAIMLILPTYLSGYLLGKYKNA